MHNAPERIILSRTDSIGDVMLTLPMAGLLKQRYPGTQITFIGRQYTRPVLKRCAHVDETIILEDLRAAPVQRLRSAKADAIVHVFPQREVARWAQRAGIPHRIGTSHRWWHWTMCNERVHFSRRRSELHESQSNIQLLRPLGVSEIPTTQELALLQGFSAPPPGPQVRALLPPGRKHVVLHPRSRGSAVEWGLENYAALISALDPLRFQCVITGTAAEAEQYRLELPLHLTHVTDVGGRLDLDELIMLIGASDALVAASTGPLHIGAACGIRAIGLYSSRTPIHPGRWAPIGRDAHALVNDPACADCAAGRSCDCITRIRPERVLKLLEDLA